MINESFFSLRPKLISGEVTCVQLVNNFLDNIKERDAIINAFLEVFEEEAIARAHEVDKKITAGTAGTLAGMVVGVKDLYCYTDHNLTCGSKILEGFESKIDATPVKRLLEADAIIIGRQNCDEFGMGSSNENSAYGPVLNPHDESKVSGGSSGGSAAAVAANMCHVSLSSDTGGSIRQPASFCGVVGLKPSYSRVSRYGLTAYSSSFDCVGVIAKEVEDVALTLEVIAGADENDSTCAEVEVPAYSELISKKGTYKIAILKDLHKSDGAVESRLTEEFEEKLKWLKSEGHEVEEIDFPYLGYLLPTYYILTSAEASANLSRYDGIRYGYRSKNATDLESVYKKSRTEGFGAEVLRRMMLGTFVLSASYHDAFYKKAQRVRHMIKEFTEGILDRHDFLLTPTTPTSAFDLKSKTDDPIQMYMSDIFTVQASVAGLPAISVPLPKQENELPLGLQVIAGKFKETELLSFSKQISE